MRRALALACLLLSLLAAPAARGLPDGRAYERVTPADKNDGDVGGPAFEGEFGSAFGQSSSDGNAIGYVSLSSFAGAPSAEFLTNYISTRGSGGWTTRAISPPAASPPRFIEPSPFRAFSDDLSTALFERIEPALAEGAPPGFDNLYLRRPDGSYRLLTSTAPPSLTPSGYVVRFAGATPDLDHVVFEANDALVPGAPTSARSVYEWSSGGPPRLVSVLPDGSAAPGAGAGDGVGDDFTDVISADGSRIYWTDADRQLYMREGGMRTVKVNASQRAGVTDGTATLFATTPDGSKAIFTDPIARTEDPGDQGGGLYEYDAATGSLRDLTPYPGSAGIQGVLGMSADGSTVYFVASGLLAPGARVSSANLYVVRNGEVELIAVLPDSDSFGWDPNVERRTSRVTSDGARLAFLSHARLTGYDNTDAATGQADPELFVYDRDEKRLFCASCVPDGTPPLSGASFPATTGSNHIPRILSADGTQVVFDTRDALVPADTNRRQDVYIYEDGRPQLISSGRSGDRSTLVEMSPTGRDIFFTTRERLVPEDRDNEADLYDARVGGGFPTPTEAMPCVGDACRGPFGVAPSPGAGIATESSGEEGRSRRRQPECRARRRRAKAARRRARSRPRRCEKRR